jgi:hypothetical protein
MDERVTRPHAEPVARCGIYGCGVCPPEAWDWHPGKPTALDVHPGQPIREEFCADVDAWGVGYPRAVKTGAFAARLAQREIDRVASERIIAAPSLTLADIDAIQRIGRDEHEGTTTIALGVLDRLCEAARKGVGR